MQKMPRSARHFYGFAYGGRVVFMKNASLRSSFLWLRLRARTGTFSFFLKILVGVYFLFYLSFFRKLKRISSKQKSLASLTIFHGSGSVVFMKNASLRSSFLAASPAAREWSLFHFFEKQRVTFSIYLSFFRKLKRISSKPFLIIHF
ncbi:hypothetical protein LJX78_08110 [Methanimicrococcus blatticola]|uniref:hypothetical protein n=1 Tax=Methanimicrococcus blatticola TaxID=91560 RepID=UPI001CBCEABF|nr:hypothetical protein [Methanimicrococcus blatticola]MBZ3936385.1 hypothetical protein [Methanimicrococcus blatticola]MCC2509547.1 hypothetical protein [Methanimicrococcus blatticola]